MADRYNLRPNRKYTTEPESDAASSSESDSGNHLRTVHSLPSDSQSERPFTSIDRSAQLPTIPFESAGDPTQTSMQSITSSTDRSAPEIADPSRALQINTNPSDTHTADFPAFNTNVSTHSDTSNPLPQTSAFDMNMLIHLITNLGTKIETEIKETKLSIDNKIEETKSEIKETKQSIQTEIEITKQSVNETKHYIEQNNEKLIHTFNQKIDEAYTEIQACRSAFETQIKETRETQSEIKAEINSLKIQQTIQAEETAKLNDQLLTKIESTQNQMRQFVVDNITKQQNKLESENNNHKQQILTAVKAQLNEHRTDLEQKFDDFATKTLIEHERHTKENLTTIQNEVLPKLNLQNKLIEAQQIEIQNLNTNLNKCETEVNQLKLNKPISTLPGTIQVVCNGSDTNDRQLPKFNGRSGNPTEYLHKLKRYYEKGLERNPQCNPTEYLIDTLENSFEGPASRWLQLIRTDIHNWEQFVKEFENKYWSQAVQRGIKAKIEAERYRNNGTLSRTEYLTERVLLLQSMTPSLTEEEIVTLMTDRFEQIIQDSISVQNITTIRGMERLLQKEDVKDGPKKAKIQNQQQFNQQNRPSSPTGNNNQPRHYNDRFTNQQAYQPKMNRHNQSHNDNHNQQQFHRQSPNHRYNNNNYQRPYRDNKPYQREPQPPRNYDNDRSYPTKEQKQLCAMHTSTSNPSTSNTQSIQQTNSANQPNSPRSPPNKKSENFSAL